MEETTRAVLTILPAASAMTVPADENGPGASRGQYAQVQASGPGIEYSPAVRRKFHARKASGNRIRQHHIFSSEGPALDTVTV